MKGIGLNLILGFTSRMQWGDTSTVELLLALIKKELVLLYRGTKFGLAWTLLSPILLLAIYSTVFLQVFQMRWPDTQRSEVFVFQLFVGLTFYGWMAETINRSPGLILSEAGAIKKVQFPLEILPWFAVLTPLVQFSINLVLLLLVSSFFLGFSLGILLMPLVLIPFVVMLCGLSYWLSALGVYFRDIKVVTGFVMTGLLFLSPIFYPVSEMPGAWQNYIWFNPLSVPIETSRAIIFSGELVHSVLLSWYALASLIVFVTGRRTFQFLSRGFADVL